MVDDSGRKDWEATLALGVRLGMVAAEAADRARARLSETGPEEVSAGLLASWLGCTQGVVEQLLRVADSSASPTVQLRGKALQNLATALLGPYPAGAAPTVPLAPTEGPRSNVPRVLGPYELLGELGHGGMGIVYRARHVKLGSECAVKVLIAGEHASPMAIARFQREAAAVAKMGKHPNIVAVFDLGEEGSLSYYAMELVEGESLRKRVAERPYAPKEAARLLEKVARALHYAHGHGVIHRDVKPENIVVRRDGEPQVMDFGLARDLGSDARLSITGQVLGTPAYMAPEQVRGDVGASDARTDVYALGAVLYELLTGIPPHGGQDLVAIFAKVLAGDLVPPRRLRAEVPRDVETVCMKALELSPDRRYASAEALADDLARFQRGEPVVARAVGRVERAVRWVRRNPVLAASGVAVLVALLGGVGLSEWRASARRRAEYAKLVGEAETLLSPLPTDRGKAIEALVTAEERLRAAQELMAAHGGNVPKRRYEVNRELGDRVLEEHDYRLARLAFSVCRLVDARRAEAEGLGRRVDEAEQREAQRKKERIEAALADIAKGLGRTGREAGAPDLDDYVFEVSGYRDEQTVKLLDEALRPLRETAVHDGKEARWTQEERDEMTFAFRVLGRLGLEPAVEPLGAMMAALWDHTLAVECGTALCNTRSDGANGPLLKARDRFGLDSSTWSVLAHSFARVPSSGREPEPRTAEEFDQRGTTRRVKGDLDGAIEDYGRAIEFDPKNAFALNNRGLAREARGDLAGAMEDYARAIEVDPRNTAAFNNRGNVRQKKGDVAGAIEDFTRAIEIEPTHDAAFLNRGAARLKEGDVAGAMKDFTRATDLDPSNGLAFNNRGKAREAGGDVDGAMEDFTRAIQLDPKSVLAFNNRARARWLKGDVDGLMEDSTRAIEIDPRDCTGFINRGYARQLKGDLDEAIGDYDRAVELDPRHTYALGNRGSARLAKGDLAGAIADWERVLELDPNMSQVRAGLANAHYKLACTGALASVGKPGASAPAMPVEAVDATRLRDDAFQHLREAVQFGYADTKHLETDADLAPLHDDPRWRELLTRLGGGLGTAPR